MSHRLWDHSLNTLESININKTNMISHCELLILGVDRCYPSLQRIQESVLFKVSISSEGVIQVSLSFHVFHFIVLDQADCDLCSSCSCGICYAGPLRALCHDPRDLLSRTKAIGRPWMPRSHVGAVLRGASASFYVYVFSYILCLWLIYVMFIV